MSPHNAPDLSVATSMGRRNGGEFSPYRASDPPRAGGAAGHVVTTF